MWVRPLCVTFVLSVECARILHEVTRELAASSTNAVRRRGNAACTPPALTAALSSAFCSTAGPLLTPRSVKACARLAPQTKRNHAVHHRVHRLRRFGGLHLKGCAGDAVRREACAHQGGLRRRTSGQPQHARPQRFEAQLGPGSWLTQGPGQVIGGGKQPLLWMRRRRVPILPRAGCIPRVQPGSRMKDERRRCM